MPAKKKTPKKQVNPATARITENIYSGVDGDEDLLYRSIYGSSSNDISPYTRENIVKISREFWERDGLPAKMVEMPRKAINHGGVTIEANDERIQAVIDEFWETGAQPFKEMLLGENGASLLTSAYVNGELTIPFAVRPFGYLEFFFVDTLNIESITRDPSNALNWGKVILKKNPATNEQQIFDIFRKSIDGNYIGNCFHFTPFLPPNGLRGRSYFQRYLTMLDLYMQFIGNEVERAVLLKSFVQHWKLEGADAKTLQDFSNANFPGGKPANPGQNIITNEKVSAEVMTPSLNAQDSSNMVEMIKLAVVGPAGWPIFAYGGGGNVNNTVSREMMTFAMWEISDVQAFVKQVISHPIYVAIKEAVRAGRMTKEGKLTPDVDTEFKVKFGNPFPRDSVQSSAAAMQMINAAIMAKENELCGEKTARRIFVQAAQELNVEVTEAELEDEVEKDEMEEPELDEKGELMIDDLIDAPEGENPNMAERDKESKRSRKRMVSKVYTKEAARRLKVKWDGLNGNGKH